MRGLAIVDDLLQHPGLYLGIDHDTAGRGEAAARILVTPLPGGAGVTLEYETFNSATSPGAPHHHEWNSSPGSGIEIVIFIGNGDPSSPSSKTPGDVS